MRFIGALGNLRCYWYVVARLAGTCLQGGLEKGWPLVGETRFGRSDIGLEFHLQTGAIVAA